MGRRTHRNALGHSRTRLDVVAHDLQPSGDIDLGVVYKLHNGKEATQLRGRGLTRTAAADVGRPRYDTM